MRTEETIGAQVILKFLEVTRDHDLSFFSQVENGVAAICLTPEYFIKLNNVKGLRLTQNDALFIARHLIQVVH